MADDSEPNQTGTEPAPASEDAAENSDRVEGKTAGKTAAKDKAPAKDPAKDAAAAKGPVVAKKKVVSKRVTPKGGANQGATSAHAHAPDGHDAKSSSRYTPPTAKYSQAPSPTWVPVLMFVLLGVGCLFIILNYARVFGEPENWRLLVGLAAILGGIITATNYR